MGRENSLSSGVSQTYPLAMKAGVIPLGHPFDGWYYLTNVLFIQPHPPPKKKQIQNCDELSY